MPRFDCQHRNLARVDLLNQFELYVCWLKKLRLTSWGSPIFLTFKIMFRFNGSIYITRCWKQTTIERVWWNTYIFFTIWFWSNLARHFTQEIVNLAAWIYSQQIIAFWAMTCDIRCCHSWQSQALGKSYCYIYYLFI